MHSICGNMLTYLLHTHTVLFSFTMKKYLICLIQHGTSSPGIKNLTSESMKIQVVEFIQWESQHVM